MSTKTKQSDSPNSRSERSTLAQHKNSSLNNVDITPSKILIHAINFAPELIGCAKYTTELAQFLQRRGHAVEIITSPPHYPGWFARPPYRARAYASEVADGIKVTRCPMLMRKNAGGFWRFLAPLSFALAAAPVVVWRIMRSRPDAVMCVEPTLLSAPVAMLTARLVGARTLLHIQDLEVDAAFVFGHVQGRLIRKAAGAMERLVLNCFGRVVTISAKMREALLAKGVRSEKVEVLRNWVDGEAITPQPAGAPNAFRDRLGIGNDQFVVLYAGHIGVKQALDVVLEAAANLMDSATIRFVIAGDGPVKARLQKNFGELTNVDFLPLQPAERLQELLAMANLHVLPQHKGVADLALPSKLGGMLASGRPILATADPGAELFQILSGVAILTPPGEAAALASAIRAAASADLSKHVAEGLRLAELLDAKRLLPLFELALLGDGKQLSAAAAVVDILAEVA